MFARYVHFTSYPNIIRKNVPNVAFFYTERHIPIEIILITGILHQIDSAVYSVIEQKSLTDLGLRKGVSGLAYYFYLRLCARENFSTPTALKIKEYLSKRGKSFHIF
ncbi:hypothetical protein BUN20_18600 [Bacteroides fragilis]|nr:hypothetical protein BUN20_18600 [Bacteroides fragilis]